MRGSRSALLGLVGALLGGPAAACPCAPSSPAWTALTTPDERAAGRVTASLWRELATWDERGHAHPTPDGVRVQRAVLELAAAVRPWRAWEFSLAWGAALTDAAQPGQETLAASAGDPLVRARWEPVQNEATRVALTTALRAPLGGDGGGPFAGAVSALGLGTWELALGAEWSRRLSAQWTITVGMEGAARAPRTVGGAVFTQGLRGAVTVMGAWEATGWLAVTASTQGWWESNVWRSGEVVPDSSLRRWSVGVGAVIFPRARLRWTLGFSVDPWFDGAGTNATAAARGVVGVWYAR